MPSSEDTAINAGPSRLACARRPAQKRAAAMRLDTLPMPKGGASALQFAPGFHGTLAHLTKAITTREDQGMDLARQRLRCQLPLAATPLCPNHLTRRHGKTDAGRAAFRTLRQDAEIMRVPRNGQKIPGGKPAPDERVAATKIISTQSRSDPVQSGRAKGAGCRVSRKG